MPRYKKSALDTETFLKISMRGKFKGRARFSKGVDFWTHPPGMLDLSHDTLVHLIISDVFIALLLIKF